MRIRLAAAALLGATAAWAGPATHLSLNGTTGLIRAPVADTASPGELQIGFSDLDPLGGLENPETYSAAIGLFPWLEIDGRLASGAFAGAPPASPEVRDLSAGLKLKLPLGEGLPVLAAGVQDIQGNQLLPGYFAAASWSWRSLRVTGGYGWESALLMDGFAGLDWTPLRWMQLAAEHTSTADSAALKLIAPVGRGVSLVGTAAADFGSPRDTHYGVSLSVPLQNLSARRPDPAPELPADLAELPPARGPVELVLQPNLITFVGTDYGSFAADLALRARVQAPVSNQGEVVVSLLSPAVRDPDFDPDGVLGPFRSRPGLDQAFYQYKDTPAPAWHVLTSAGAMRVFGDLHAALLNEQVVMSDDRRNVGRLNLGAFISDEDTRGMLVGEYRRQFTGYDTSIGLAAGQFVAGDHGVRVDLTRLFGDTAVSLFAKGYGRGNDAAGGLAVSLPFGHVPDKSRTGFLVRGGERWSHGIQSTFGGRSGANLIRPNLLVELRPDRNLRDSFLDYYRLGPAPP